VNDNRPITLSILVTALVLTLACGLSGRTLTITINESDVNRLIERALVTDANDDLIAQVTSVDMHDGFIRVSGTYRRETGATVSGSCDLVIRAQDGMLQAEITAIDVEGFSVSDARIANLNERLTKAFAQAAAGNQGQIEFTSVEITADALKIGVKLTAQ